MNASPYFDTIWTNVRLAPMTAEGSASEFVEDGAVAERNGRIAFVGPRSALPSHESDITFDCGGRWMTPGLIDCHTHLVYAGNRAREFDLRASGASYAEVSAAGGGIVSTVAATRAASEDELVASALPRLDRLMADGVTTIEIKSGYGLDPVGERTSLRAARRLGEIRDVGVRTTFLGAHALPPEARGDKEAHIDAVIAMMPALADEGLIDSVDGFCEGIAFSPSQIARVFETARSLGLPVRLHADQLSDQGGAALAARFGASSADHLEWTSAEGVHALAKAGTVATLLPGAFHFLRETKLPPIDLLRANGVAMAVSTDCNPGTSPMTSLLAAMNLAATCFGLTVEECLLGVTRNAARALGLEAEIGTLEVGKRCDLAIWSVDTLAELVWALGALPLHTRIRGGR